MEKRQDISLQNIASVLKRKGIEAEFINIPFCEQESMMLPKPLCSYGLLSGIYPVK